jgi:hypothetical protein
MHRVKSQALHIRVLSALTASKHDVLGSNEGFIASLA